MLHRAPSERALSHRFQKKRLVRPIKQVVMVYASAVDRAGVMDAGVVGKINTKNKQIHIIVTKFLVTLVIITSNSGWKP